MDFVQVLHLESIVWCMYWLQVCRDVVLWLVLTQCLQIQGFVVLDVHVHVISLSKQGMLLGVGYLFTEHMQSDHMPFYCDMYVYVCTLARCICTCTY